MDQIFTGENKKKQVEFLTFFKVYVFSQWTFPGLLVNFLVLLSHIPYKKSEELPLGCLFDIFTGLWLSTSTFCIKGYDSVKHFVCVLVLLSLAPYGCWQSFTIAGIASKLFSDCNDHMEIKFSFCQRSPTIPVTANDHNDHNCWERIRVYLCNHSDRE